MDLIGCISEEYSISNDEARIKLGNFILSEPYAKLIQDWSNIAKFKEIPENVVDFFEYKNKGPDDIA